MLIRQSTEEEKLKRKSWKIAGIFVTTGFFLMVGLGTNRIIKAKSESRGSNHNKQINVLLYHHLLESKDMIGENSAVMSVENFEAHMDYLHNQGYYTLSLEELEDYFYDGKNIPEKSVLITFDDGYLSNIIYGYPILKAYGMRASIFPTTAHIQEIPQAFDPRGIPRISYKEMVLTADVFEYGSHTNAMHGMEEGIPDLLRHNQKAIFGDLKLGYHRTGSTPYFAYPFGAYNEKIIKMLKELGYTLAFTTKPGKVTIKTDPMEINRYPMYTSTSVENLAEILNRNW